jgi:DNA-binding NarL/FixJ family response regulator
MKVLIADDHALFRDGVSSLLKAWGLDVAGQAGDGFEALAATRALRPDLVLMDIQMPLCNGLQATRLIKAEMPEIRIIIVTVSDEEEDLFEAIKSGAEGYVLKNMSGEEFSRVINDIAHGEAPLSKGLAAKILTEFARMSREPAPKGSEKDQLSDREREVLQEVASGASNKEIAARLFISESTVNFHMKSILAKLHVRNRAQAVAQALQTGLVRVVPLDAS